MISASNSLNLNYKVRVMKEAPGPLVSERIFLLIIIYIYYIIYIYKTYIYYIYVNKMSHHSFIDLSFGLSPVRHLAIAWSNADFEH